MLAGFLITRLLLVCLLSDVNYKSVFASAQQVVHPRVWQGAQAPHDYLIPHHVHQVQAPEAQENPWLKLVESLVKDHQSPKSPNIKKQPAKYPAGLVASPAQPGVEPKKIELDINIPLHYIFKGFSPLKDLKRLHDVKDFYLSQSRVPHLEDISIPTRSDQRGLINPLKRKSTSENPGFHIKPTAPIQNLRDKGLNLHRLGQMYQDQLELVKRGLPETVPNWPILHHVVRPHHGKVQNLQTPESSCCHQAQLQRHWTLLRNFLFPQTPRDPSAGSQQVLARPNLPRVLFSPPANPNPAPAQRWTERAPPELQGFQQSAGLQSLNYQNKPQIVVPDRNRPPDNSMVNPQFNPRASLCSQRQNKPIQWLTCPRFYEK
ncbi:uncharacterized protein [Nothobranchius furzeri]|uniref:Transcript variant X1 n=1 Tax=Nothobranchius furzeri TaxID=105023 RepID=A0A9D3BZU2_NOTFU|nr:transcript variant X1 [Nothobranchius furzeri]KAF7225114.1 transcript variant X2 [Nothobranchius furzeri]